MMRALSPIHDLVFGERIPLPPELPAELLPPGVVLRRGRLVPTLGGWLSWLEGPAAAVALPRTIVVHPNARITRRLLLHELAHIRQWREDLLFPLRYTLETLRVGYARNRYEQEAREAEASPITTPT